MCIGIGIVIVVPEDGPVQFFGKSGNSSHDTILHEMVPVALHNRVAKIEYTYPHALRLDAPDVVCRNVAMDLGVAEMGPFGIRLKSDVVAMVQKWIVTEEIEFSKETLQRSDLTGANLRHANLYHADLRHANLAGADLRDANLRHANLAGANLRGANLEYADLREADLLGADLIGANLRHADLYHANLAGADLRDANLDGVIGMEKTLTGKVKGAIQ